MKKQLILSFILALFAGISSVYAQCASDGFHPSANQPYVYVVSIDPAGGYLGTGTFDWYVTQDVNIINAANIIPAVNTFFTVDPGNSTYHSGVGTTNQLGLTWTAAAVSGGAPFYLVLRYREANPASTTGCSAENIRVWQILPINTFLLAVSGAQQNGTPFANANQCAADVTGATVAPGTPTVTYVYGTNTLYYTITASGYSGDWTPELLLSNLTGAGIQGQNYAAVEWTADLVSPTPVYTAFTFVPGNPLGQQYISPTPATITDPANGTPILVRIQIANVNFETLANQPITMGADGATSTGLPDIWGGTGPVPDPCAAADPFAKAAIYTILARPTVNPGAGMPNFITQTP